MATEKLTQKQSVEEVKPEASIVITQQEIQEGGGNAESLRRATIDAIVKVLRAKGVNEGYQTESGIAEMYPNLVKSIDPIETGIRISFWDETSVDIAIESGGLAFDEMSYDTETGYLHLYLEGEDVVAPCYIGGGGGGSTSGSVVKIENLTGASSLTVAHGEPVVISFSFYDYDTSGEFTNSSGTLELSVNGTTVIQKNIEQGNHSIDIGQYMAEGTNKVKVKITNEEDMYGMKTWTVNSVALSLSSTFDDTAINTGDVIFRYTPVGNNIDKTIHFFIDDMTEGNEIATPVISASNRQQTQILPAQSHGAHKLMVYATAEIDGVAVKSNTLVYDVIWSEEGNNTPIIACSFSGETTQYSTVSIPYIVYIANSLTSPVILAVDGNVVANLTVDRTVQTWNYKATEAGVRNLTITCGDVVKTIALTVKEIGIDVEPITTGLIMDLNPAGKTNNDDDRTSFGYVDGSGVNHPLTYSENFDWTNGGFQTDADGNTYFCVKCGTSVTFDRSLFADDATRNGKEMKFVFKATNCRNYDAQIASCMDDNIGFVIQAQKATVRSQQTSMEVPYCEDSFIEMDINIEPDTKDRVMMIWLEGVPSKVAIYADNDNFTQNNPAMLTIGSNDCDVWIYRIKAYESDLTRHEIRENWIADSPSAEEMLARYNRNNIFDQNGNIDIAKLIEARPMLRVLEISADRMTTAKKDYVTCTVKHTYKEGGKAHCFTADGVRMQAQGTSSAQYGEAGLNLDLEFTNGFNFEDKTTSDFYSMTPQSIGVNYFNIKVNVASSENANNVVLADEYNNWQPYINPARQANPKVRDTVEGHPCVIFYTNTSENTVLVGSISVAPGETILYACGDMNNSKKNLAVFGQQGNPNQACVEIMNNTNNQCLFKSDDLSTEKWDGKGSFEFRYPDDPTPTLKAAWQRVLSWVVSTDRTAATGENLAESVVYDGTTYSKDTAEYRAAKFKAEYQDYFIKDSLLYHYLFTERHSMVDNRAKNVFVSTDDGIHWDFTKDYDNDTADGNDNEGGLTLSYGLEDTDTIGTKDVFNASQSVLWCNVRDLLFPELTALFVSLESQGAWNAQRILTKFTAHQAARPEALVIEDMWKKYIRPYTNNGSDAYLEMMYGTKADQRKQYEVYQEKYMSSKYQGVTATSDTITFRAYTPSEWGGVEPSSIITVTPYADMYVTIKSGSGIAQVRAKRGVAYPLECPIDTLNDTEIYVYGASNIADVGDLAPLYVGFFNIASAIKLRHLKLGDGTEGYVNTNATSIGLGNNNLLETLDIQGCPNIEQALDLTGCDALLTLEANGSGITGVSFSPGGKIVKAHIPAVNTFSARSLKALEELTFASYDALRTVRIEDCPTIDTLDLITKATGVTRVRLLGIDWLLPDMTLLDRLLACKGLDEADHNLEQSVLTGKVYVPNMKQSNLNNYMAAWSNLDITYGTLTQQYLVTFLNWDGTKLHEVYIDRGENCPDPIEEGIIGTPTRESTVSTVYTYDGWDSSLDTIIGARTITATFAETARQYTVRWISTLGVVLDTQTVDYGSEAIYSGEIPIRDEEESSYVYYLFEGWDKSTGYITGDLDVWAIWQRGELPAENTPFETLLPAQIYAIYKSGRVNNYVSLKDRTNVEFGFNPAYTNIPYEDLVTEPTSFDGQSYVDTGFKPFENGIANAWTLVCDLKFTGTDANGTLVSCMQESGYYGFNILYNAGVAVQYSTNTKTTSSATNREIVVIRHKAGDRNVTVYGSKAYTSSILIEELTKSIDTVTDKSIILGAAQSDTGTIKNYGKGTIYSCRLWQGDLGDTDCRKIVSWPRENYLFEVGGFDNYYYLDEAGVTQSTSIDFICASLLERTKQMNTTASNAGGFSAMPLFSWMQTRLYDAFPQVWKFMMKNCQVKANKYVDGSVGDVEGYFNAYLWVPAYAEVTSTTAEPWIYEGNWVTFFVDNYTRIKWLGAVPRDGYQRFITGSDPCNNAQYSVEVGDVWINTSESSRGYLRMEDGTWFGAHYFWLRGASVTHSSTFGNVLNNGNPNNNGYNALGSNGVCPRFSI